MPPSDPVRLRHMLDAARETVAFGAGCTGTDLLADRVLTLALGNCIEITGEAASKISTETHAAYPEIPWPDIIGMRNRSIHAYFDVDFDRLGDTISDDLPPLIVNLQKILSDPAA